MNYSQVKRTLYLLLTLYQIVFVLFTYINSLAFAAITLFFHALLGGIISSLLVSTIQKLALPQQQGSSMGAYSWLMIVTLSIVGLLFSLLTKYFSMVFIFRFSSYCVLFMIVLFILNDYFKVKQINRNAAINNSWQPLLIIMKTTSLY